MGKRRAKGGREGKGGKGGREHVNIDIIESGRKNPFHMRVTVRV